jgi:glycerophosphoryl diester phosphodiesterase
LPAKTTLLLGHRGARHYAPENTLAAFDLGLEHRAHGFEFDVRATRDRQAILCHDPKFHRLVIRRHTLQQLQAACKTPCQMPPTLQEVLARYGSSAFLNIEIKVRGVEDLVAQAVKQARLHRYFISSFLPSVVRKLHALDRSLVLGALAQTSWQLRRWRTLPAAYVVPHYRLLSRSLLDKLHRAGKTVITWTVNDPRKMLRLAAWGVDGIISDDTKLLVETLQGRSARSLSF